MECIIYKLECLDENIKDCYVGSTNDLKRRFRSHRFNCNNKSSNEYNLPVYNYIRDNGGIKNWKILELERFVCDSKIEKLKRERYYIELLESSLNNQIPSRTHKEYYENNKQDLNKQNKEYNKKNKEHITEQKKQKITCECGCIFRKDGLLQHQKTSKHIKLMEELNK